MNGRNEDGSNGESEAQLGDGYGCSCGFRTDAKGKFTGHIMSHRKKDGADAHQSLGRINLSTGEVTMPPYRERTPEQIHETYHGKKKAKGDKSDSDKIKGVSVTRTTDILANASQIKLIPRIFTMDFTPIMRATQEVVVREFGWRADMPFDNLCDTIFYNWLFEHGITLNTYTVEREEEEVPVGS